MAEKLRIFNRTQPSIGKIMKRILGTALAIALSTAAFVLPAQAQAQVGFNIFIGNAPPPLRYEAVPARRAGHEWVPGYWNVERGRHVWVAGSWHPIRVGYYYQRPSWSQGHGGWNLNRGGWQRDSRHDNRFDNRRDSRFDNRHDNRNHVQSSSRDGWGDRNHNSNASRYDRDGDGVPNRFDSAPNNPRRN